MVRVSQQGQASLNAALIFSGNLSNGSLLKTVGTSFNGVMAGGDGMSLFGNNTYTGTTIINAGQCVIAGTNATSLVQSSGTAQGGSAVTFIGANGSAQSATTLQAFAGGVIILDNNAAAGDAAFIFGPNTPLHRTTTAFATMRKCSFATVASRIAEGPRPLRRKPSGT